MPCHAVQPPELGQLVDVRQRHFVVTDVLESTHATATLDKSQQPQHHLVSLTSIEDDALGEELQVIWELEPRTRVYNKAALPIPTGFDPPGHLDAFLNAVRWGASVTADGRTLQAPFRSGIDMEDYQLDPVARAVQMPRANLLIADDVGLGKTIEAGLVMQELIMRQRVRSVLIVCPASLQVQWQEQMRDKFGLEVRIVNADLMRDLRRRRGIHVNPWTHFPRLITSIDYLKRDRPMRLLKETLPGPNDPAYPRKYDLLILDEAHNVAPSGRGRYAIDSLRTKAIRTLAPHVEHKLFLTATPHNGYAESFSALLELLDNQRFARGIRPDPEMLQRVMVRRLKTDLVDSFGQPKFKRRNLEPIVVSYSPEEHELHMLLKRYTALRRQYAATPAERTAGEFVLKLLKKRLFSSPAAFAKTLSQHQETLLTGRKIAKSLAGTSEGLLRARLEDAEEMVADDRDYDEAEGEVLHTAVRLFSPLTDAERALLERMLVLAKELRAQADSKAKQLLAWLQATVRPNGQWSEQRVIIFTQYRDTQNWLQQLLASAGLSSADRLLILHGGLNSDDRERIKAAFQASPAESPVRILLATDAASEGIDLQRHCHRLIHYEIPWNPNRLEQRNGRIDRHGQRQQPLIYHFAPARFEKHATATTADPLQAYAQAQMLPVHQETAVDAARNDLSWELEFLMLAVRKVEQIREDLGKVGPVIAEQVSDAMLGRRTVLDTVLAEHEAAPARRLLKFEQNLEERIRRLSEQLADAQRTLHLSPENIHAVVAIALALAGQPPLIEASLPDVWPTETDTHRRCPVFHLPALHGPGWAQCTEGLAHPHTGEQRPIVFDQQIAHGRDDVVLAHLNHRLVRMSLRLLRAEVWHARHGLTRNGSRAHEQAGDSLTDNNSSSSTGSEHIDSGHQGLYRVTARVAPDHLLGELAVVAHARLVITGGDSQRLHEEIITAGGEIRRGVFRRFDSLTKMDAALAAATNEMPAPAVLDKLRILWPNIEQPLERSLDVRSRERAQSLARQLVQRRDKEMADIRSVLEELAHTIQAELSEEPQQLSLFAPNEREQYQRNTDFLRSRLAQIPTEIIDEQALIQQRYLNQQVHLFPVAVTWLIPERIAI